MHDGAEPWRIGDLAYLEREINYWTGPRGYQACAAGIQATREYAERHGVDGAVVLPAWSARYSGVLTDIAARIDPDALVADCDGAEIVCMPSEASLAKFVAWCRQHVQWV